MWGNWKFGECSKTCATGTREKNRSKEIEAENGGNECYDESGQIATGSHEMIFEDCNTQPCPGNIQ